MSPKAKVDIAREHLTKAQEELNGDHRDAVQWAFASLEAAIGEDLEQDGFSVEDAVADVETVVEIASEKAS